MTDQKLRSPVCSIEPRVLGNRGEEDARAKLFPQNNAKRPQFLVAHLLRSFGGGYYVK